MIDSMASNQLFANDATLSNVEQLRWVNRIILVSADQHNEAEVIGQFRQAKLEIDERHILWFVLYGEQLTSNYEGKISENFSRDINKKYLNKSVKSILIGKDGGVKDRQQVLSLNLTLALIDTMSMRQSEIKRDKD
ncbi:MAG: hypothetical protein ACI9CO_002165 [Candidatus Azotimanducaceae bacterium]|jgi:hypothetical protein